MPNNNMNPPSALICSELHEISQISFAVTDAKRHIMQIALMSILIHFRIFGIVLVVLERTFQSRIPKPKRRFQRSQIPSQWGGMVEAAQTIRRMQNRVRRKHLRRQPKQEPK